MDTMPKLPAAAMREAYQGVIQSWYTADQMHAYAREYAAAQTAALREALAKFAGFKPHQAPRGISATVWADYLRAASAALSHTEPNPVGNPISPMTDEQIDRATSEARDDLLDYIDENSTYSEGVIQRIRKIARAAIKAAHGIR